MNNKEGNIEKELLDRILNKEMAARKDLYNHYAGYLTTVCTRYIPNREDMRDVLQESFIKIFTSIHTFEYRGKGALKAWMTKIVINESLQYIREEDKMNLVTPTWELPDREEENDPTFDRIPMGVLMKMIHSLPTGYRTVFNLYVFEEKSHKEIASLLGIEENSSASQLHRAKNMLATWIKEFETKKQLQDG